MRTRRQDGVTSVEFAIVGLVFLVVFFVTLEFGRIVFSFNVLQEGVRRGARVAAVCPVNDPAIATQTVLLPLPELTSDNVRVEYLNETGAVLGDPAGADYTQIRFVRVTVVDYSMDVIIPVPLVPSRFRTHEFSSILPRESLGVPRTGAGPVPC